MHEKALLSADELALLREQFAHQDNTTDGQPTKVTLELPERHLTACEPLYLVRQTDNLEFRYPLLADMSHSLSLGTPLILEKGRRMRDLRVPLAGCVHNQGDPVGLRLADISMSGFLVFPEGAAEQLKRVQIELEGEHGEVALEADVEAVRQVQLWHQWAVAYRFVSLKQGDESLRQLIYDFYQRLVQT